MTQNIEWRLVKNFPNYEVSNTGIVRNIKTNKLLKPYSSGKGGYLKVKLTEGGKTTQCLAHRLVAQAFIPNPHNLPTVNHRTGIRTQNDYRSLEWASYKDQAADKIFRQFFGYEDDKPPVPKLTQVDLFMKLYFS